MNKAYRIPEDNLGDLQTRIGKLARRCKRIGVQGPVLFVDSTPEEVRKTNDLTGIVTVRRYFTVTIDSPERPKVEGYEFIAVLSPQTDENGTVLGNALRAVPGASVTPEIQFRNASNYCDHCKSERRRLETFIITDGTTQRQIGRNCLANYLGLANPHALAELAQILIDAADLADMAEDEGFGGGGRYEVRFPLDIVLETAASAIRNYGWLSNKSANEFGKISTSGRVIDWLNARTEKDREKFEHPLTITDEDKTLATETQAWLESITDISTDYMWNLSLFAKATSVVFKNFGVVVSAINAYSREKERAIRRNARIESDSKSEFIGTVGERITIENLVLVFTTTFATDFGVTTLYKFKSGENIVTYFSSRDLGFAQGDTIAKFIATVKKHEVYEDVKQTVITRGKVAPRELSKADKKAVNKLKRILKTIEYSGENSAAYGSMGTLIDRIKDFGVESF